MAIIINGTTGISDVDGSASVPAYSGTDSNTGMFFPAADTIAFAEGGVEAMRLDSSGFVGINTTSPEARFQVNTDTNKRIIFRNATHNTLADLTSAITFSRTDGSTNLAAVMGWNSGGLALSAREGLAFATGGTSGYTETVERMRITSGGNVGIGTTAPSSNLVVNATTATQFDLLTNGTRYFTVYTDTTQVILGGIQNTIVSFRQNDTLRMQLDTSGNLLFNSGYGSVAVAYGCRAWVKFTGEGTPTIRASGNVSSITDVQTGVYNVNLTTAMPDSNYAAVVTGSEGGGSGDKLWAYSISTSAVRVVVYTGGGALVDNPNCQVAVFR